MNPARKTGLRRRTFLPASLTALALVCLLVIPFHFALAAPAAPAAPPQKWAGVDEAVVEKIAAEAGRYPVEPLINTDQGDLLLFAFLLAGAVGGFLGGYYWRALVESGKSRMKKGPKPDTSGTV